jgi:tetratricopeptide (TPR) repeat protein
MSHDLYTKALELSNQYDRLNSNLALDGIPTEEANTIEIQRLYASNYRYLGQFAYAIRSLDKLSALDPEDKPSWLERAMCLEGLGKKDEALVWVSKLVAAEPINPRALIVCLRLRVESESPAAIIDELHAIKKLSLVTRDFYAVIDQVRTRLIAFHDFELLVELDTQNILQLNTNYDGETQHNLTDIYNHFESLGFDCDFGYAQRMVGAEPMGLFKWSGVEPHHLMEIMNNRLEDFDNPEHYSLVLQPTNQYFLKDSKYGTVTQIDMIAGIVPEDALLKKMIQRQSFLKRKLLSDIKIGKKIFVYRFDNDPIDRYVEKMVSSLQGIGMKKILITRAPDDEYKPGSTRVFSAGVMIGYISINCPLQYAEWDQVVQSTYAYFEDSPQ